MRKMHTSGDLYAVIMDLELRHLRCLVAIVDAGTFTDAAIELGISQAAVSRNLIALEQILGVRLLHRTSRSITPTTAGGSRFASAVVGHERRYCALAADDPWARRRSIRLDEIPQRTLLIDRRSGTTTPDLWPAGARPQTRPTLDIDDWLSIIAAGGGIGITPEGTTAQYRRDGVVFRPLRDAPPIAVRMIWRRHDPHPSTHAAVALLTELYGRPS